MEIGKVVEIGEREIVVTPTKREDDVPAPPQRTPEPERVKEPA